MASVTVLAKQILQSVALRYGYRIERIRQTRHAIDAFDLALRAVTRLDDHEFFFIQVGANDGISHDPLRAYIERYHWSGILIEPQPRVFARLCRNYEFQPQLRFVNAALAAQHGSATLYTVQTDDDTTGMASFDRALLQRQLPLGARVVEMSVPTMPLGAVIRDHGVVRLDLLQIDAEGYDAEIVRMVDFSQVRPSIVRYEHRHLSQNDRESCENLLAENGYQIHLGEVDTTAVLLESARQPQRTPEIG